MGALTDRHEVTILNSQGILIKNQRYQIVLTNHRIVFTGDRDHVPRSINLPDVQDIALDTDDSGDPVIIVSAQAAHGEIKQLILHFSPRVFPNALQQRYLWFSEINKRIQQPVQVSPPVIPDTLSPAAAFCPKCGKRLTEGSFFCDGCGAKIQYPFPPLSPGQGYSDDQEIFRQPGVSAGMIDLPRKDPVVSAPGYPWARQTPPVLRPLRKEEWKKKPLFSGSLIKKPFFLFGIILAVAILAVAVFVMTTPSVSSGFNLTSPGINVTLPDLSAVALPTLAAGNTQPSSENPGSPDKPALTFAPGDPGAVLATYPSLFNNGDGEGLYALLSTNMQSHYHADMLNTELATARSNGYSIEKIQVHDQTIEEGSAVLDADIIWKTGGSLQTSSPKLFLVYEDNQWKLDSLELHP